MGGVASSWHLKYSLSLAPLCNLHMAWRPHAALFLDNGQSCLRLGAFPEHIYFCKTPCWVDYSAPQHLCVVRCAVCYIDRTIARAQDFYTYLSRSTAATKSEEMSGKLKHQISHHREASIIPGAKVHTIHAVQECSSSNQFL